MARNDVYLYINATSPAEAVVTAQANVTATDFPELTLGDAPLFNFYFTDGTASWPTWAGNAQFTVDWALSDATSHSSQPYAYTTSATPISGGWQIRLPLNQSGLVDAVSAVRTSQAYPVAQLWQHIRVRDSNFNPVTYAMVRTNIRKRAMWDLTTIAGTVDTDATVTGDLTVGGNLTVAGNTQVTVNSVTGLGTGVAAFLATPSSANLRAALTDETGSGSAVFSTSPTLVTPTLGAATATSLVVGGATGGATSGVVNAQGLQINGVPVGTSTDTYWSAVTGGISYTGGLVQAALNPTTTTIGINGPNLAASINAKAPRGGIAFDGTASSRVTSTLTGQNIGTDPFSLAITIRVPSSAPAADTTIIGLSSNATTFAGINNRCELRLGTSGTLDFVVHDGTNPRTYLVSGFQSAFSGKVVTIVAARAGTTPTVYVNGVSQSLTDLGDAGSFAGSVTSTYLLIGFRSSSAVANTQIYSASLYNLALSAADCLEIAENGGAVPFRYQFGSQSLVNTAAFENAANANFDYDTFSGASATGFTATYAGGNSSGGAYASMRPVFASTNIAGWKFRLKASLILNSGAAPRAAFSAALIGGLYSNVATLSNGSNVAEFTLTGNSAIDFYVESLAATDFSISGISLQRLGAVCHFALDEGIGYQLHDASTNRLDAVMTTTGVAHLVAKREGYVRTPSTGISWSGSHEPKNILGAASTQRMLPNDAVVAQIVLKASGASTNGASVNSTNTAARWSAVAALSTTKSVRTVANSGLPAATADADTDILVDPDTVNYTGTIQADVRYCVAEG